MRKSGLVVGMAIGAGMSYLLDPEAGERRRARLRARIEDRLAGEEGPSRVLDAPVRRYGARQGDLPGLESATLQRAGERAPADRTMALLAGALALYGVTRRGTLGFAARTLGAGMLWSELRQPKVPAAPAGRERRRTVDIQKTLFIEAPPEQVYQFWTDYENFPLFMSSVREVRDLGGGRSHWVVRGPVPPGRRGNPGGPPVLLQPPGRWCRAGSGRAAGRGPASQTERGPRAAEVDARGCRQEPDTWEKT